jgi:hypothetical protein
LDVVVQAIRLLDLELASDQLHPQSRVLRVAPAQLFQDVPRPKEGDMGSGAVAELISDYS